MDDRQTKKGAKAPFFVIKNGYGYSAPING